MEGVFIHPDSFMEWWSKMHKDGWELRFIAPVGAAFAHELRKSWQHKNGFILYLDKPAHLEILKAHQLAGTTPPPF